MNNEARKRLGEQQLKDRTRWIDDRKDIYVDLLRTSSQMIDVVSRLKIDFSLDPKRVPSSSQKNIDEFTALKPPLKASADICQLLAAGEAGEKAAKKSLVE
jgi:hypothetical protein